MSRDSDIARKNRRTASFVAIFVCMMIGLAFASVPLYRVFCKTTGYGGTPVTTRLALGRVTARRITVHFNADISPELDWSFRPDQQSISVLAGQKGFASFTAVNNESASVTGSAIYNVLPLKVGKYFHKIQCFCFGQQTLAPREKANMPVVFFIDPAFADDIDMKDVGDITLSYTFFKSESPALQQAIDRFTGAK